MFIGRRSISGKKINTINNPNFLEIENFWIYYLHKQKAMSIARELGISWYISWIDFIQFNLSQPEFFSQCRLTLSKNFLQFDILVHFCRTMWQVLLYIASFRSFGPENKIFPIHDILQKKIVYIKLKKIIILFSIFFLFQMAKTMAKNIIERIFFRNRQTTLLVRFLNHLLVLLKTKVWMTAG